jgi:rSAM/selenodomain-associated transferase 1
MPTRTHDKLLLIAARAPVPGQTKTRLGSAIGMSAAASLYRAFLDDLAGRFMTDSLPYDVAWAYTPESHPFQDTLSQLQPDLDPQRVRCVRQEGDDWATRQGRLLQWGAEQGYASTVLTASDSPQMTQTMVMNAFEALESSDVVVGPVHDGGYYLVGVRGFHDVVSGVPMSTSSASDALIRQAQSQGLRVTTIESTFDIDVERDLILLAELCASDPDAAPATCRALKDLGLTVRQQKV